MQTFSIIFSSPSSFLLQQKLIKVFWKKSKEKNKRHTKKDEQDISLLAFIVMVHHSVIGVLVLRDLGSSSYQV
jgi:hypothetical protein